MDNIENTPIQQDPNMTNDIIRFYESSPRYNEIISYRGPQIAEFTFNDNITNYSPSTYTEISVPIDTTLKYSKYDANIAQFNILGYTRSMFVPVRDSIYEVEVKINGTAFEIQGFLGNGYYGAGLLDVYGNMGSSKRQLPDYEGYVYGYSTGSIQTIVNFSYTTRYLIQMARFNPIALGAFINKSSSSAILTYSGHITINEIDKSFTYTK